MAGLGAGVPGGPALPSVSAMSEGLRWPGKQLEIKQVAGVVAFTSNGNSLVCQPMDAERPLRSQGEGRGGAAGRDAPSRSRETPPPRCGWADKTLIVLSGDADDPPPFDQHFSLSDDGRRLVEVVGFKGGRSSGFTMSRVWDRAN